MILEPSAIHKEMGITPSKAPTYHIELAPYIPWNIGNEMDLNYGVYRTSYGQVDCLTLVLSKEAMMLGMEVSPMQIAYANPFKLSMETVCSTTYMGMKRDLAKAVKDVSRQAWDVIWKMDHGIGYTNLYQCTSMDVCRISVMIPNNIQTTVYWKGREVTIYS